MTNTNRISIHDAAQMLGMSDQTLRLFIQNGKFPFATANKTGGRWCYVINRQRLEIYLEGRDM